MSQQLWLLLAVLLIVGARTALGDWKSDVAKRAIGRAAQAGIEAAVRNAVSDAAYDAAMSAGQRALVPEQPVPIPQPAGAVHQPQPPIANDLPATDNVPVPNTGEIYKRPDTPDLAVIGSTASAAVEAGMTAANVASAIDTAQDVADAARTVKKVNDVRKAIKSIRR